MLVLIQFCSGQITKLKINHNPFAKGFRDEGTNKKRWVSILLNVA